MCYEDLNMILVLETLISHGDRPFRLVSSKDSCGLLLIPNRFEIGTVYPHLHPMVIERGLMVGGSG
jgi:hypothetical protein